MIVNPAGVGIIVPRIIRMLVANTDLGLNQPAEQVIVIVNPAGAAAIVRKI